MQPISEQDMTLLMKRFPAIELSYELHKKVPPCAEYDVALAIPYGKKYFLWCTFWGERDVCFLMELSRDRRVIKMHLVDDAVPHPWVYGTILYGVSVDGVFVMEDILQCRGICLHKQPFGEKLAFFREMATAWFSSSSSSCTTIRLPFMTKAATAIDPVVLKNLPYVTHHLQFRSLGAILPYVNFVGHNEEAVLVVAAEEKPPKCDFRKPQYRKPTVFSVKADAQYDIYRLYTGKQRDTFYGLACIPNYKTSVLMNGLFRNIRENGNLDLLEESEDEEDFQDCKPTRYVDLDKCVTMECRFHPKFKRWVPVRVGSGPVVTMDRL